MRNKWLSFINVMLMLGWFGLVACTATTEAPTQVVIVNEPTVIATVSTATALAVIPPTATATTTPVVTQEPPTPENCSMGWSWATGPDEPEFAQVVQGMMAVVPISGTVRVSTYGENDGCGRYHAMSTDFTFTIPVPDPTDEEVLAPQAEALFQLAQTANQGETRPAPNLGNIAVVFTHETQQCTWRYAGVEWNKTCNNNG